MAFEREDPTQVEVDQDPELRRAVQNVTWAQWRHERTKEQLDEYRSQLLKILASRGTRFAYVMIDGEVYKATAVSGERAKVDEEALLCFLTQEQIDAITTRKVSTKLLTEAVATGRVDPSVVAQHTEIVPVESYPRITKLEGESEQ